MSGTSGSDDSQSQKRSFETNSSDDGQNKRPKTASVDAPDDELNDIFDDPLPGFGDINDQIQGESNPNNEGNNNNSLLITENDPLNIDFDNLPANFLDNDPVIGSNGASQIATPDISTPVPTQAPLSGGNDSQAPTPGPPSVKPESRSMTPATNGKSGSTNKDPSSEPKQFPKSEPYQYQVPINRMNPLVQQAQGIQGLNTSNIDRPLSVSTIGTTTSTKDQLHTNDPSKLNDAIAAAGVDIQQEEEILLQQQLSRRPDMTREQRQAMKGSKSPPFLNPYHVASFMHKVAKENGVMQNFLQDGDLLELMSASCQNWLSHILTKTIILSRHRRRGIPSLNSKSTKSSSIQRSELSKELRNLANRQKELEEKRVSKRIVLGLEKSGPDTSADGDLSGGGKAGAEETLHRAANATAAMMTMNPGRKKYSWMTSNAGASDDSKVGSDKDGAGRQSSIISIRGDNGLRFREIRTGGSVTMKDLLGSIEDERMGTEKAIIKGYAKLKD